MTHLQTVFLIRHGQTDHNATGRWQGCLPTALNAIGHEQARRLADYLRHAPIDRVFTSDLPRAAQTAEPLATGRAVPLVTDPRLRELDVGVFQGRTRDEIIATHPDAFAGFVSGDPDFVVPGGESRGQLQERAYRAWQDAIAQPDARAVALVSHGGTLRELLRRLFPDHVAMDSVRIGNTSITIVNRTPAGVWELAALAISPHLQDPNPNGTAEPSRY